MNPIEWFYAKGDKHFGPVHSAELKRMATAGELLPEDLVWREGMAEWTIAKNVRGLYEEENKTNGPNPGTPPKLVDPIAMPTATPTAAPASFGATAPQVQKRESAPGHLFDWLLDFIRTQFPAAFVESTTKFFLTAGRLGFYAAMALTVAFTVLMTVKVTPFDSTYLTKGAISFLVFAVLQYVGARFCEAGEIRNRSTSENLSSTVFLDCFALLAMLSGATALIVSIFVGVHHFYWLILGGLATFVIAQFLAFIAIHPSLVNVKLVSEMRPCEEAIGIVAFLAKASLRLAPVVYGVSALFGSAMLLYACVEIFTTGGPVSAESISIFSNLTVRYAGAFPLIAYIAYLLTYLLIDVSRAVLVLPSKLDKPENPEMK